MPYTIAHQNVAEFINDALGDLLDDVAFADLVDDVLDDLAARFAAVTSPEAV